jgi:phytoene synthase
VSPLQPAVRDAYSHCETLTRTQAANFYYGIRLLSAERRRAMCAVYAFSRQVDDIGDGSLADERKLALLDEREQALRSLERPQAQPPDGTDLVVLALADACRRFPVPVDALAELIEGVRMDVQGVQYEEFDQLVLYCRRVAGAIGRVCLAIFALRAPVSGAELARAESLADDLGVALQLTNILRDVREDAENGRVYLPGEDLRAHGLTGGGAGAQDGAGAGVTDGAGASSGAMSAAQLAGLLAQLTPGSSVVEANGSAPGSPIAGAVTDGAPAAAGTERVRLERLVRFEAERAREWFSRGGELAPLLDRRSAACLLAMAGIYRRLLDRIEAEPLQALERRVSLPVREKAWVALRGMLGAGL